MNFVNSIYILKTLHKTKLIPFKDWRLKTKILLNRMNDTWQQYTVYAKKDLGDFVFPKSDMR